MNTSTTPGKIGLMQLVMSIQEEMKNGRKGARGVTVGSCWVGSGGVKRWKLGYFVKVTSSRRALALSLGCDMAKVQELMESYDSSLNEWKRFEHWDLVGMWTPST